MHNSSLNTTIALNAAELAELASCESVIEHGLKVFQAVGVALITIREKRLYRAEFTTFEAYCVARWGFTDEHARRLMRGAEAFENLSASPPMGGELPTSERQIRPLVTLAPDQQRAAWQQAVETAPDGRITGAHVAQVAQQFKPTPVTRPAGVRPATEGVEPDLDEDGLPLVDHLNQRVNDRLAEQVELDEEDEDEGFRLGDVVEYRGHRCTVIAVSSAGRISLRSSIGQPLHGIDPDVEVVTLIERAPERPAVPRLSLVPKVEPAQPEARLVPVVDGMKISESHPVGYAALYATDDAIGYGKATCAACGQTHNGWTAVPAGRWKCRCGATTNDDALETSGRAEYELEQRLKTQRTGKPALVHHSSESVEWYTPEEYIRAARAVMGDIDLDPASCEQANRTVKARRYYTKDDDGLKQEWFGRVFVNPPYGWTEDSESSQAVWSARLIAEWEAGNILEGILLVNASTAQKWFAPLWRFPICFTDHRIRFERPGAEKNQPPHGSVFVYFGHDVQKFTRVFSQFGAVVTQVWRDESVV